MIGQARDPARLHQPIGGNRPDHKASHLCRPGLAAEASHRHLGANLIRSRISLLIRGENLV